MNQECNNLPNRRKVSYVCCLKMVRGIRTMWVHGSHLYFSWRQLCGNLLPLYIFGCHSKCFQTFRCEVVNRCLVIMRFMKSLSKVSKHLEIVFTEVEWSITRINFRHSTRSPDDIVMNRLFGSLELIFPILDAIFCRSFCISFDKLIHIGC